MIRAGQFEKVSFEQFAEAWKKYDASAEKDTVKKIYDGITLPRRATKGSAGYEFRAPEAMTVTPGSEKLIPTGIRAKIETGYVLMLFPRSSLGFKYRLQLDNTVGIIDSDYYNADNEGHIFCKLTNDTKEDKTVEVKAGNGFAQGIFLSYGITDDDEVENLRTGGFGSTTKKEG